MTESQQQILWDWLEMWILYLGARKLQGPRQIIRNGWIPGTYILAFVGEVNFSFRSLGLPEPKEIMHNMWALKLEYRDMKNRTNNNNDESTDIRRIDRYVYLDNESKNKMRRDSSDRMWRSTKKIKKDRKLKGYRSTCFSSVQTQRMERVTRTTMHV